ncbi:MAG: hypothetical protein ABJB86_00615 [Bacteroidota bacterium]
MYSEQARSADGQRYAGLLRGTVQLQSRLNEGITITIDIPLL